MKLRRIGIRLLIAFGVLSAALIVSLWLISRVGAVENPPCRDCSEVNASARSQISSVTLCDLLHNSELYNEKLVRIRAVLKQDSGYISLSDPAITCEGQTFAKAGFPESFASCDGTRKMLKIYTGYDPQGARYDGVANVVVVGRWGRIQSNDNFDGELGLTILCLETVSSIGSERSLRIRYSIDEIARRIKL